MKNEKFLERVNSMKVEEARIQVKDQLVLGADIYSLAMFGFYMNDHE